MSALFIGRGDCRLGTVKKDAVGNVVEQTGAKWEPNAEGGCVAICDMDTDKMEPTGAAEVSETGTPPTFWREYWKSWGRGVL